MLPLVSVHTVSEGMTSFSLTSTRCRADRQESPHFCLFGWIAQFYADACGCSYLVDPLWMPFCRHPWGCAPTLGGSSAAQLALPTRASPVVCPVREEQEGLSCCCPQQYILLFTVEIGLHLFGGLQMLVESRAVEEVAFLQANYPHARRARGFTSTGNNSEGKGGRRWIILGSAVPQMLPSAVRTAAMRRDKVPSAIVDLCMRKPGENWHTPCK